MAKKDVPEHESESANQSPSSQPRLPTLTHLQFLVLDTLSKSGDESSAQALMGSISQFAFDYRGAKFYQLMGRLVEGGFVESWQQEFDVAGTNVSRTHYRLLPEGSAAWRITAEFYKNRLKVAEMLLATDSQKRHQRGRGSK